MRPAPESIRFGLRLRFPSASISSPWRLLAVFCLIGVAALALVTGALPSIGDAAARVRAIDARVHTQPAWLARGARFSRAVVAVEDEWFYSHSAVDPLAIGRAFHGSLTSGADPGRSTIIQQLAKVLYISHPETVLGRVQAIGLAVKLEQRCSKDAILSMYANAVYFGHGFYGISAASRGYFGMASDALSWGQAALLAGLVQSPSALDPVRQPARARAMFLPRWSTTAS